MAILLTARAFISGSNTKTFEGQNLSMPLSFNAQKAFTDGVLIDTVDLVWVDQDRVLNATSEDLDLSGTLTNAFGDPVVFAKVNGIFIKNKQTTAGETLKIGGAAANQFLLFDDATDIYELGPDGTFFVNEPSLAGLPVTAGTGDLLKLDAGATANLTFDIAIWGRSA